MNSLENLHANRIMTVDLGLLDDLEILCALNVEAEKDEFSIDEDGDIWGTSIDEEEYEDRLTFKTERSLRYYAAS